MLLWSNKNVTFSYERVPNKKQSIALTLGHLEFPSLFADTIAKLVNITSRTRFGINVALEYRFYLMQRNVRPTPDGIYLVSFMSYYGCHFQNGLDIIPMSADSAGMLKANFYILNLGVELGYQFVFWKRFTLDLFSIGFRYVIQIGFHF